MGQSGSGWEKKTGRYLIIQMNFGNTPNYLNLYEAHAIGISHGCMIEKNIDYRGNEKGARAKVENQKACAKLSLSRDGAFWTYQPSTKICWPKTSKAGRMAMENVVSGNIECGKDGDDCYDKDLDPQGAKYDGSVSTTVSGRTCQAWASTTPHNHKQTSTSLLKNYCRNPDGHTGPWCYTTDPKKRWEDCPVSKCKKGDDCYDKDLDPQGAKYDGSVSTTVSGRTCQAWASTTPHNHKQTSTS